MSRLTHLAQADLTFSELATTPRFRGFHSVNRGQLLASSAMDLGDQTGLNRGHPLKQKIHLTPPTKLLKEGTVHLEGVEEAS